VQKHILYTVIDYFFFVECVSTNMLTVMRSLKGHMLQRRLKLILNQRVLDQTNY